MNITYWKNEIGLSDWEVTTERIDNQQVIYPTDCTGSARFFIGVEKDIPTKKATIYHMRTLTDEDVVHELLHIANPNKDEDWINEETNKLLKH